MLVYYVMKLVSKIFCLLPWSVGRAFGDVLGRIALFFVPEWRMQITGRSPKNRGSERGQVWPHGHRGTAFPPAYQ